VASFSYRATTLDGKVVEGTMEATAETQVVASLRTQGYIPAVERGHVQLGKKKGFRYAFRSGGRAGGSAIAT
jgi:type II secretory pathway component PulF